VAHSLRAKNSWVAYPCGFGLCKGGSLLIHAGLSEEELTLCKNYPSAPVKHAGRKKRAGFRGGWPGLDDLEFVDIGLARGYHCGNSRESRERWRVPQVPVFGTWVLGWQFLFAEFPYAGRT
jgi:hypothetical protein